MINIGGPVGVFGINVYTDQVINFFDVQYIVDDFTNFESYKGISIIKSHCINNDFPIINCAGGRIVSTQNLLENMGLTVYHYCEVQKCYPSQLQELIFNKNFESVYAKNVDRFERVRRLFCDDKSVLLFDQIVNFRLLQDPSILIGLVDTQPDQYFESFLNRFAGAVFYDIGCFDGQNTMDFLDWNGYESSVIFFEPDKINFNLCKNKFLSMNNVHGLNVALGDEDGYINMIGENDTASGVKLHSTENSVRLVRLDDLVSSELPPPSFIKIDIEGAEIDALRGMIDTISKFKPDLAICVYHDPCHFIEVPELILSLVPEYKVRFRHYTESIYESVMFFYT